MKTLLKLTLISVLGTMSLEAAVPKLSKVDGSTADLYSYDSLLYKSSSAQLSNDQLK